MYLLQMAFRNIWRNKRRTFLNVIAFTVNITILIFFVGFYRYRIEDSYSRTTKYLTGHIQIHHSDYEKEERKMPVDLPVPRSGELCELVQRIPGVVFAGKRIEFAAFISNGKDKLACLGIGFEPEKEAEFGVLSQSIIEGEYLSSNDYGILIGHRMAELFNLKVGDTVLVLARTKYNTPNLVDVEIKGIFNVGFGALDKSTAFFSIPFAEQLLQMEDEATEIMIGLEERGLVPSVLKEMEKKIPASIKKDIVINDWTYYAKPLVQDVKGDTRFMAIFLFILVSIAVFGMINTMSMSVFERTKEIGTMRAIGMARREVVRLFIFESVIVSLAGVLCGWGLGGILCLYIAKVGIPLGGLSDAVTVPMGERMYCLSEPIEFVGSFILGIIAGVIGGLSPAIRAGKLKIVDSLREV
jgi:putative ABC transport system permease protein